MIFSPKTKSKLNQFFCNEDKSFVLTNAGFVYSFGYNSDYTLGHEFLTRDENIFIPKLIENLNDIKTIGLTQNYTNRNYYYLNTHFLTNDGCLYFCGFDEKKPKLIESEIKFNYLYSKEGKTIAIKENSKEIFELKSNSIIKSEFNNIFDFYANIGITYGTISLNTSQLRETEPMINFMDLFSKPGSPETSKSFKDSKLNDNKVLRFEETKSENDMFLMTESEPQISQKRISQELNTNIEKIKIWRKIDENIKIQIKYFYVFNDYNSITNVLLITLDDRVFGFGSNYGGVLGLGHKNEMNEVTEIPELKGNNIKEFYNGLEFVIAMNCERNKLFGWGQNEYGQLGRGYKSGIIDYLKPDKLKSFKNEVINQISCGELHTIILTDDGLLYGWGLNKYGQIGIENIDYILEPKEIDFFLRKQNQN